MILAFCNSHKVVLSITTGMSVSTLARNPINVVTVMHRYGVVCYTSMLLFSGILHNCGSI